MSHAFGFDGNPGNVMMFPAKATICLAPASTRSSPDRKSMTSRHVQQPRIG